MYEAALLIIQHALRPLIDSEINHTKNMSLNALSLIKEWTI